MWSNNVFGQCRSVSKISHWMGFNYYCVVNSQKVALGVHIQLITFQNQLISRWPPQPVDLRKHADDLSSVNLTDTDLKLGVVVVKHYLQQILFFFLLKFLCFTD